jgi:hypothetical protein
VPCEHECLILAFESACGTYSAWKVAEARRGGWNRGGGVGMNLNIYGERGNGSCGLRRKELGTTGNKHYEGVYKSTQAEGG